jgi:hypothetical protein
MKITYPTLLSAYLNAVEQFNVHYKEAPLATDKEAIIQRAQLHMIVMTLGDKILSSTKGNTD